MGDQHRNSEKKQIVEHQSFLFDDLIIQEILTRLPNKSILRFKSVSKQWYSTLSSSEFASAYLVKSPLPQPSAPFNTLFIKSGKNYYLFSYNDDQISGNFEDNLVKFDPSELGFEKDDLRFTGSCNGLVCLTPVSGKYFILWNPATGKMHKYGPDDYTKRVNDETEFLFVFCGFWYASFVDDYKFVRILKLSLASKVVTNCIVHVFSLRENKWTSFDFDCGHDFLVTGHAELTNERLCWPAFVPFVGQCILSFDLGAERFDAVKFEGKGWFGVMGGCLSDCDDPYRSNKDDKFMHIYESPGVLLKSIGFPKGLSLGMGFRMIGFTRTGKFFVTGAINDEVRDFEIRMLGVVDTGTKPMQYTTLLRFTESIEIARYVPCLVSPSFPIEEELSKA